MYAGAGLILVLCTEHQPTVTQTSNNAVRVFTVHHLIYLNAPKVFNTVFECMKIKVFVNTLINIQRYLNTSRLCMHIFHIS